MPRFSVALDDEENEWVERLADERDRSKSSIVASIVEAAHAEGYNTFVSGESDRTTVNRLDDLEDRVAELEARESARDALAEERYTADVEESDESGHAVPARGDGRDQPSDAPHEQPDGESGDVGASDDGDDVTADVDPDTDADDDPGGATGDLDRGVLSALEDYLDDRPPHKAHGKRAAVATVLALREHGTMSTGGLQEAVYGTGDLAEHYTDARTLWNSVSRYFDDVPGVEKAGYGEWRYTGDDAVREAVREE